MAPSFIHLTADFQGVPAAQLSDQSLISGVLVSAAGAAGLMATGTPMVLKHPDGGLSVIIPSDGCHISLHTSPDESLALLDVLARAHHDPQRALDVVKRRLESRTMRSERRERG